MSAKKSIQLLRRGKNDYRVIFSVDSVETETFEYEDFEEAYQHFVGKIQCFDIPLQNIYHNIDYLFYKP